jgi:RNA polymerase sigma factor (TIGR02999 family)
MSISVQETTTRLLAELRNGDGNAADRLLPLVYDELRVIAANYFSRQPAGHTLQPTALVHEVFLRLVDPACVQIKDRGHFFALAAKAMRQILVDHARRKRAAKRGGPMHEVTLVELAAPESMQPVDLVALDDALLRLAGLDERQSRIVELRFFGGLSNQEVAEVVGVSLRTVEGEWSMARGWLRRAIDGETG